MHYLPGIDQGIATMSCRLQKIGYGPWTIRLVGYRTFAANILRFSELKSMPMDIDLSLLDQGSGIPTTLLSNKAKWHKRCRDRSVAK